MRWLVQLGSATRVKKRSDCAFLKKGIQLLGTEQKRGVKHETTGTSLVVQWLGLRAPNARGMGSSLVGELRSPHAARRSQKKKKKMKPQVLGWWMEPSLIKKKTVGQASLRRKNQNAFLDLLCLLYLLYYIYFPRAIMGHAFCSIQFSPQLTARSLGLINIDVSFMNKWSQLLQNNYWFREWMKKSFKKFRIYINVPYCVIY